MRQEMTQKTTATLQRCNASNVRLVKNRPFHRRKSTFASFMAKQKEAQKIRKTSTKQLESSPNRYLFQPSPTVILYLIRMHIRTKMYAKQVVFAIISPNYGIKDTITSKKHKLFFSPLCHNFSFIILFCI